MVGRYCSSFSTYVSSAVLILIANLLSETKAQCDSTRPLTALPYRNQSFSSPNYPFPYPANASCTWLLQAYSGLIVKVVVEDLNLEINEDCSYDRLSIFNGDSEYFPRLAVLCRNFSTQTFYSSGSTAFVSFRSDDSVALRGFNITYTAVDRSATTTTLQPWWMRTTPLARGSNTSVCISGRDGGMTLTAGLWTVNYVQSTNYPAQYPDYASCAWKLQADSGLVIHLRVISMDLEVAPGCVNDAVTLYDASWESSSDWLATLCSPSFTKDYYSTGSSMYITFKSDSSVTSTGFRLMYETAPVSNATDDRFCISGDNGGVTLTAKTWTMKYIRLPNYPDNYPDDASCAWKLQTDPGYVIHLSVNSLILEDHPDCSYDAVTLYDAPMESSARRLATLCGRNSARDYYSSGRYMFITFKSDSSVTYRGFSLSYEAVPASTVDENRTASSVCNNGNIGGASLTAVTWTMKYLQSPNYPGLYPNDASCVWKLQTDPGYVIYVRVVSMDLEVAPGCIYDAVILHNASWESTSDPLAKLCSTNSVRDYYSTRSYMFITFQSDGYNARTGFRLMYQAVYAPPPDITEPPLHFNSHSTAKSGIVAGIIVGVIVLAGFLGLLALFVFKRRQAYLKRSRRAQGGGSDGLPPYTTSASHFVLGGNVLGPPGYAPAVGGHQVHTNLGYAHFEGYGPPPAYADLNDTVLHGIARISSTSGHFSSQNNTLGNVDSEFSRSGSDVAAANTGNEDPRAKEESLADLAPPPYDSLNLPPASVQCAASTNFSPAASDSAPRPLPSLPLSALALIEPSPPPSSEV